MRTPDGRECPHYYVNVQRWRSGLEECRLLEGQPDALRWTSAYCASCPVPDILRANACPTMRLHALLRRRRFRFWEKPRMTISASCSKSGGVVTTPYTGCGQCHEAFSFIIRDE